MYVTKRSGFAMILAIFVVVLVALGGVMLLGNGTIGGKSTSDNYLRAQAELLAMSATEFAVMRAQGFNTSGGNCLNQLNIIAYNSNGAVAGNEMFDINVSYTYSFRGTRFNNACNRLDENTNKDTMILMDVAVTAHKDTNLSTEPIRVFKRTWQKL